MTMAGISRRLLLSAVAVVMLMNCVAGKVSDAAAAAAAASFDASTFDIATIICCYHFCSCCYVNSASVDYDSIRSSS